jgi:hypothetical protein
MPEVDISKEIDDVIDGLSEGGSEALENAGKEPSGDAEGDGAGDSTPEPYVPEGFTFVDAEGNPVSEYSPEVAAFLRSAQVRYKALGEDHTKPFHDVVRGASRGHLNTKNEEIAAADKQALLAKLEEAVNAKTELDTQAKNWDAVLQAAQRNNIEPFLRVVEQYIKAQNAPGPSPELLAAQERIAQLEGTSQSQRVIDEEISPYLKTVADKYGVDEADFPELVEHAVENIQAIPPALMTQERVAHYLQVELLGELEAAGYQVGAAAAPQQNTGGMTTAEYQELLAFRAEKENAAASEAAAKAASGAPASGAGTSGGESKSIVPKFNTPQEYMKWLKEG